MNNVEKGGPILSKVHKGKKIAEETISRDGRETTFYDSIEKFRGVKRKKFKTSEGIFYYADRSLESEAEAKRVMRVYNAMEEANLPIVDFAKIIRRRIDGEIKHLLAMEDITEDGKYEISEIEGSGIHDDFKSLDVGVKIDEDARDSWLLKKQIIQALAVMHNNKIVEFHGGSSFAIRFTKEAGESSLRFKRGGNSCREKRSKYNFKDFQIIDYPNFFIEGDPGSSRTWKKDRDMENGFDIDILMQKNLKVILGNILSLDSSRYSACQELYTEEFKALSNFYWQIRKSGETHYSPVEN